MQFALKALSIVDCAQSAMPGTAYGAHQAQHAPRYQRAPRGQRVRSPIRATTNLVWLGILHTSGTAPASVACECAGSSHNIH